MDVPRSVLLLLLITGNVIASGPPLPLHAECPQWLLEYIQWHRATKFTPDANYLLYDCVDSSCAGLGDRLRGIIWMLRMAVNSKRVLLINMEIPVPIHLFFLPTHIDWTVPAAITVDGQTQVLAAPRPLDRGLEIGDYYNKTLMANFMNRTEKWIWAKPNQMEDFSQPEYPPLQMFSRAAACVMQALYQPTDAVEQVVSEHLAEMQVNPYKPYIAVHLRVFNMKGEDESRGHTLESEERILTSIVCARQMAPQCNVDLSVNPVVLVTDGLHIRRRVALRLYHQLTTSDITPHHFDATDNHGLIDRHLETIADFVIMSRATGLFMDSMSGFSRLASYLGGHINLGTNPCLQQNQMCHKHLDTIQYHMPVSPPPPP